MNALKLWYAGLTVRERGVVAIGAGALCAGLLFAIILLPLEAAVAAAQKTRDSRRDDLQWMRANAPEIQASGSTVLDTGEPPMVLVDRVGREAGLGNALRGTQPSVSGVRVQLEAAPFDTLVTWLATLEERYGLAIDSISVDRTAKPGAVNANITFTQARR